MLTQDQQIIEQIKKAENILITFTRTWNGDAVASALALYLFIKKFDKKVLVAAEKFDQGSLFQFLPSYDDIRHSLENIRKFIISLDTSNTEVGKVKYIQKENQLDFVIYPKNGFFLPENVTSHTGQFKYDLIFVLDTPDLESLGQIYEKDTEFFYRVPIINISHHSNSEEFGQINIVELTSIATSEIVFNLMANYSRDLIDEDIATCLLAGIISKTKSFKTQNITPQALSISSQLISMGGRREEIANKLYRSRSINVLKLWGRVLARLQSDLSGKLVWTVLNKVDFDKTKTSEKDLSEVIDELIINIPSARVILLIYEIEDMPQKTSQDETGPVQHEKTATKALVYSVKNVNSLELTSQWQGIGSRTLAQIIVPQNLSTAEQEIITNIKNKLKELPL